MSNVKGNWIFVFVLAFAALAVLVSLGVANSVDSANITNESIIEEDIAAIGVPADDECLTYDSASQGFDWDGCGSGGAHPVVLETDTTGTLDISNSTNLSASSGAILTGDDISTDLGTSVTLTSEVDGVLPVANGGTGLSSIVGANRVFVGLTSSTMQVVNLPDCDSTISPQARLNYDVTTSGFTCPNGIWNVINGGTGTATITSNEVMIGLGTAAVTTVNTGTIGFVLTSTGATAPTWQAASGGGFQGGFADWRRQTANDRVGLSVDSENNGGIQWLFDDWMQTFPFIVGKTDITLDGWWTHVSTSAVSSTARFCIYDDSGSAPNNLIREGGTVDTSTTGDKSAAFSAVTLSADTLYWFVIWAEEDIQIFENGGSSVPVLGPTTGGNSFTGLGRNITFTTCPDPAGVHVLFSTHNPYWFGGIIQ